MTGNNPWAACLDKDGKAYGPDGLGNCYQKNPQSAAPAFFGYMGCALALILSNVGAAYGTAKSGIGLGAMGPMSPQLVMKCMIPIIMAREVPRLLPDLSGQDQRRQAERESAAIIAFTSAIAAYGAFFIPKAYGTSIAMTGSAVAALWGFLVFYVICLVITWAFYTRPGGLLHDAERRAPGATPQAA